MVLFSLKLKLSALNTVLMLIVMIMFIQGMTQGEVRHYKTIGSVGVVLGEANEAPLSEPEPEEPAEPHWISGQLWVAGDPLPGVEMVAEPNGTSCVTDENGCYSVEVPYNWSGKLIPMKQGCVFEPSFKAYYHVTENVEESLESEPNQSVTEPIEEEITMGNVLAATGRIGVGPMVISLEAQPGETIRTGLNIQNMAPQGAEVTVDLADLEQQEACSWYPVDLTGGAYSCASWMRLGHKSTHVALQSMSQFQYKFDIHVPEQARGFYCAALVVQPVDTQAGSPVDASFVVPVQVHVNDEEIKDQIVISNVEFAVPFNQNSYDSVRMLVTVENQGPTLACFNAEVTTMTSESGQAQVFEDVWIMPGAQIVLEKPYTGPALREVTSVEGRIKIVQDQSFTRSMGAEDQTKAVMSDTSSDLLIATLDYDKGQRIKLTQDATLGNPFTHYSGLCHVKVATNFNAFIRPMVETSCVEGQWLAKAEPSSVYGPTQVMMTVQGENVDVSELRVGEDVTVAKLGLQIIPQIGR